MAGDGIPGGLVHTPKAIAIPHRGTLASSEDRRVEPGATFAGLRIVSRIGVGGTGEVYLVEHPRLTRRKALKVHPRELHRQ